MPRYFCKAPSGSCVYREHRLSLLLTLEIAPTGRAAVDRDGPPCADPAGASRTRFGERRASTANCSSSGLKSRNRASPSTWSSGVDRQVRDGAPFCGTTRRTLPRWTCHPPDHWLRSALCLCHRRSGPQKPGLDQRHNKSDGGMDRAPAN
jgi:hypothetical protein